MGVANNHIRDQGATGLLQTLKNLRKRGLLTAGAGKDLAAARKPAVIDTHGVKVAILAYDAIAASYHATDTKVGSAPHEAQGRQGRHQGGPRGRRRRRHRLPALGHRVSRDRRRGAAASWPARSSMPAPT